MDEISAYFSSFLVAAAEPAQADDAFRYESATVSVSLLLLLCLWAKAIIAF